MSYLFYNEIAAQSEWHLQQALQNLEALPQYQSLAAQEKFFCDAALYDIYAQVEAGDLWGCAEGFGNWLYEEFENFHFQDGVIAHEQLLRLRQEVIKLEQELNSGIDDYYCDRLNKLSEFLNRNETIYSTPENLGLTLELPEVDYAYLCVCSHLRIDQ